MTISREAQPQTTTAIPSLSITILSAIPTHLPLLLFLISEVSFFFPFFLFFGVTITINKNGNGGKIGMDLGKKEVINRVFRSSSLFPTIDPSFSLLLLFRPKE